MSDLKHDSITLSCKLKSGAFESSIDVPLYSSCEEIDNFVRQWLAMMDAGIKIGQKRPEAKKVTP